MKFVEIGVRQQMYADGKKDALRKFNRTCTICCDKGIRLDCDYCPVKAAHASIMAYYADREFGREAKGHWELHVG